MEHRCDRCDQCGRTRFDDGVLLIQGRCVTCAPDRFMDRRELLREQARMLLEEEAK